MQSGIKLLVMLWVCAVSTLTGQTIKYSTIQTPTDLGTMGRLTVSPKGSIWLLGRDKTATGYMWGRPASGLGGFIREQEESGHIPAENFGPYKIATVDNRVMRTVFLASDQQISLGEVTPGNMPLGYRPTRSYSITPDPVPGQPLLNKSIMNGVPLVAGKYWTTYLPKADFSGGPFPTFDGDILFPITEHPSLEKFSEVPNPPDKTVGAYLLHIKPGLTPYLTNLWKTEDTRYDMIGLWRERTLTNSAERWFSNTNGASNTEMVRYTEDGKLLAVLASTDPSVRPQILASSCCEVAFDAIGETVVFSLSAADTAKTAHAYQLRDSVMREIASFSNTTKQVLPLVVSGNFALFATGETTGSYDSLVRADMRDKTTTTVLSLQTQGLGVAISQIDPALAGMDGNGEVYFGLPNVLDRIFIATIIPASPTPKVPSIIPSSLVDSASKFNPATPGGLYTLYGTTLADGGGNAAQQLPLPTRIDNVQLLVNDKPAPLLFVGRTQINFQMPTDVAVGNATIKVLKGSLESATITVPVVSSAPALFRYPDRPDLAIVQSWGDWNLVGTPEHPAEGGSLVTLYGTALGLTRCQIEPGKANPPGACLANTPLIVRFGGVPAEVLYSGTTPGSVGLYQLNVRVPEGLSGRVTLTVTAPDGNGEKTAHVYVRL